MILIIIHGHAEDDCFHFLGMDLGNLNGELAFFFLCFQPCLFVSDVQKSPALATERHMIGPEGRLAAFSLEAVREDPNGAMDALEEFLGLAKHRWQAR